MSPATPLKHTRADEHLPCGASLCATHFFSREELHVMTPQSRHAIEVVITYGGACQAKTNRRKPIGLGRGEAIQAPIQTPCNEATI
jgi:hypothetical protein